MEEKIVYFESSGMHNTEITLKLAKERAIKDNIKNVIISSISGFSAQKALEIFKDTDIKLTIVSLGKAASNFLPEQLKERLKSLGHNICFTGDVKYELPEAAVTAFRRFGEGLKVCVEITLAAVEAGLIPVGQEVIAAGGTGKRFYEKGGGVDTAIVIEAMKSHDFFVLEDSASFPKEERRKIKEIICKPR
ncbi:MAG: pyruvate kinase alpha/beta domain-containing protein [Candidatus Bathyarchaeia archaeon]